MTVIGDKVCSFPKCSRLAVAHVLTMHYYQTGNLLAKNAVCELHHACVMEPDSAKAHEMLKTIQPC